jgi:MraZ protein
VNFYGEITQKVDGKGRVSIPADFRRVLEAGDPDWTPGARPKVRAVWGDPRRKYLECYTISAIRKVEAGILKMPAGSPHRVVLEQFMITGSDTLEVDNDGRIVLNQKLRDRINLSKDGGDAVFAGTLQTFKIWRPEDYEADKAEKLAAALAALPEGADVLTLMPQDLDLGV